MTNQSAHPFEGQRIALLRKLDLLDAPMDPELDDLVRLAAEVTGAPMAFLSVIEENQLRFLARHGFACNAAPREASFCGQVIEQPEPLVVIDATLDVRFARHPFVTGPIGARSCAGFAVRAQGLPLACLLVLDPLARSYEPGQLGALGDLASLASAWFERRRVQRERLHDSTANRAFALRLGEVLRPPLQMLEGHAQLLLRDGADALEPAALHSLGQVLLAAQRVGKLLADVQRLVKAETTQAAPPRVVDLDLLARQAIATHQMRSARDSVQVRLLAWPTAVRAAADVSAVFQVVSELLSNAVRYSGRDTTLTLATSVSDGRACLSFTDEGLELDADRLAQLFQPFDRLPTAHGEEPENSGLGLLIARTLANAMNGDIGAECKAGAGCMFTLELPLYEAALGGGPQDIPVAMQVESSKPPLAI